MLIDSDLPPWLVRFQRGLRAVSSKKGLLKLIVMTPRISAPKIPFPLT